MFIAMHKINLKTSSNVYGGEMKIETVQGTHVDESGRTC